MKFNAICQGDTVAERRRRRRRKNEVLAEKQLIGLGRYVPGVTTLLRLKAAMLFLGNPDLRGVKSWIPGRKQTNMARARYLGIRKK